jgi:hypothetical protein
MILDKTQLHILQQVYGGEEQHHPVPQVDPQDEVLR